MWKRFAVTALIALSGLASASPALDLFNQATYYIATRYNGFTTAPYQEYASSFRAELDAACANSGEACPYSAAVPIVQKMLDGLSDGHSYLLSAAQRDEQQRQRSGLGPASPRLGVVTRGLDDSSDLLVADVWEDSPASRAGLRRGDRLVSLNGTPSATLGNQFQLSIATAVSSGAPVRLGVRRGAQSLELTLLGNALPGRLPSFRTLSPGGVGYIRIPAFDAPGRVAAAVHALVRQVQRIGLRRLVVDVRDNPGGIDFEMLASVGAFVQRTGFTEAYREGNRTQVVEGGVVRLNNGATVYATPNPALYDGKLVVLVNSHSYSGAEYLAQLIQDAHAGVIIGEATGGLGNTGSSEFDLPDGSALVLTIFKSQRLDGSYLPQRVTPDEVTPNELELQAQTGHDLALERAIEVLGR